MLVNPLVRLGEVLGTMSLHPEDKWRIARFEELVTPARGRHTGYEQRIFAHYVVERRSESRMVSHEVRKGKVLVHFERSNLVETLHGGTYACF